MKLLFSYLVGILLFTYVEFGSFSPVKRENERRLKGSLSKTQLEVLRDSVLALQDHKNAARLVRGHIQHKMVSDYSTAGNMIENAQDEQLFRETHAEIEKRKPWDFGYNGGRSGKRRSYSKGKSEKNDEQEPFDYKESSRRNDIKSSFHYHQKRPVSYESDEQVPDNHHEKRHKGKSEHKVSVPGFTGSIKGFDSKAEEFEKWEED